MYPPERLDPLQRGWAKLLERYGVAPADAYPVFDVLVAAHSAPDRHYHNLEHVAEMLRVVSRLVGIADDPSVLQLAAWFHDAVYDPRARDNEDRSAELAAALLGPVGVPRADLERVGRLVRATAHLADTEPAGDRETAILLDADLAILGASPERYQRYAADIRREYAWVPEADFRAGRSRVIGHFLARHRLFRTDLMYAEGEAAARANLRAELASLSG
jgi:predicted metal-dependent HD superfamily phosphohydrolase